MAVPEGTKDQHLIAEAAEWLAALDAGTAAQDTFEAWRSADPRHASTFAQVAMTWQQAGELRGVDPAGSVQDSRSAERPSTSVAEPDRRRFLGKVAAAGIGLIAAGGGTALLLRNRKHQVATAIGERRTVPLPDGSSAELNTDTQLAWSFDRARTIWLEQGEVAFTVVADAARPFIVHAGDAVAQLERGRYNVRLHEMGPRFLALAGRGLIDGARGARIELSPVQAVMADGETLRSDPMTNASAQDIMAWQGGEIVFDGMPLGRAVAEFNRYLDRKIIVGDPSIGSVQLGGRFHVDDPQGFLSALRRGFNIRSSASDRGILLTAA